MTSIPVEIYRIYSNNFNCIISKAKDFFCNFIAFLKPTSNLEPFKKKGESPSFSIFQITDSKRGGYLNV